MQVGCVEHGRFVLKRRANNLRFIEMHRAESLVILFPSAVFLELVLLDPLPLLFLPFLIGVVLFVSPFARNGAAR